MSRRRVLDVEGRSEVWMRLSLDGPDGSEEIRVGEPTKRLSDALGRVCSAIARGDLDDERAVDVVSRVLSSNDVGRDVGREEVRRATDAATRASLLATYAECEVAQLSALGDAIRLPSYPSEDDGGPTYHAATEWEKVTADYAGIPLTQVGDLLIVDYLVLRRDALIWTCQRTQAGREWLENAYRLTLTDPDRESLREQFGK